MYLSSRLLLMGVSWQINLFRCCKQRATGWKIVYPDVDTISRAQLFYVSVAAIAAGNNPRSCTVLHPIQSILLKHVSLASQHSLLINKKGRDCCREGCEIFTSSSSSSIHSRVCNGWSWVRKERGTSFKLSTLCNGFRPHYTPLGNKNDSIGQEMCGLMMIIDDGNIKMIKNIITDVIDFPFAVVACCGWKVHININWISRHVLWAFLNVFGLGWVRDLFIGINPSW